MIFNSFWKEAPRPMIGLAPMDGVTDPCFRRIVARHAKPDLVVTEFTSVDGVCHGAESELSGLIFDESERPVIAQIYGGEPEAFFHVAQLVCELGFDGLDINMGCPAKAVSSRGCGAGLIKDPPRAKAILQAARKGIQSWADGAPLAILERYPKVADWFLNRRGRTKRAPEDRRPIPLSLKTRLGINQIVITDWIQHLLEAAPAAISIHGRTLTQGYRGAADWDAIARAAEAARRSGTLILGNGDLTSLAEAFRRIGESGVDGALIGRAALGNPWIFRNLEAFRNACRRSFETGTGPLFEEKPVEHGERLRAALEHAYLFQETYGLSRFSGMRKHLGWYCRGFQGASALRAQIVRVQSAEEAESVLTPYFPQLSCA